MTAADPQIEVTCSEERGSLAGFVVRESSLTVRLWKHGANRVVKASTDTPLSLVKDSNYSAWCPAKVMVIFFRVPKLRSDFNRYRSLFLFLYLREPLCPLWRPVDRYNPEFSSHRLAVFPSSTLHLCQKQKCCHCAGTVLPIA